MLSRPIPLERGFSLIEIAVALVIFGLLVVLGVPAYQTWIANTQIRNLAETVQNGMRLAQAEAAKRNTQVDFVLTNDNPANNANPTANTTGTNWVVRVSNPQTFIQGKPRAEGSRNATLACVGTCPAGFDGTVAFSGLGRTTLGGELDLKICNPVGGDRPMGIVVSTGGSVRMCNPKFAATDPQGCPAAITTTCP